MGESREISSVTFREYFNACGIVARMGTGWGAQIVEGISGHKTRTHTSRLHAWRGAVKEQ